MRDRLQNHVKTSDVSTRHYDRYDYLTERRAAMQRWNDFMERVLAAEIDGPGIGQELAVRSGHGLVQQTTDSSPAASTT